MPFRVPLLLSLLLAPGVSAQEEAGAAADLLARLGSSEFAVRRDAATAARESRDPRVAKRLAEVARTDPHPTVRAFAAESLGYTGDPDAPDVLLELAGAGPSAFVREHAMVGLGATGDGRAFDVLVKALHDPNVGSGAARGLGELGDRRGYAPLAKRIREHGPDARGFTAVAEAALRLDRPAAAALLLEQLAREDLGSTWTIVQLLQSCGDVPAVRDGVEHLVVEARPEVRRRAAEVLGGVGDLGSVSVLLRCLHDDDEARAAVIRALGGIGHEFAVDPIARWTADPDPDTRLAATEALARIAHPTAMRPLLEVLRRTDEVFVAIRAAEGLGRIGDRAALPELAARLDDASRKEQPPRSSRIWYYPHNTSVCDVAWWAARRILDGVEPCAIERLSRLGVEGPLRSEDERKALRAEIERALGGGR